MDRDTRLDVIAECILAGKSVDWLAEESASGPDDQVLLRQLRTLAQIAALHRGESGSSTATLVDESGAGSSIWGHLTLLELVGRGSSGQVYRAWDPHLDRQVALKLLRREPDSPSPVSARSRVVHEGRLLARVRHPHVVTVYGADTRDGIVGIWTEFVRGITLQRLVGQQGRLGAHEAVTVVRDVCRALEAVHSAGLLHHDINARNVMREEGGRVVLMDFGAGRDLHEGSESDGSLLGTPLYLAPEVFAGQPATKQSDIYSVGVLLFYLLTASYPVQGSSVRELGEHHRRQARQTLAAASRRVSRSLARLIDRALAVDPAQRFQTADEMASALEKLVAPGFARLGSPAQRVLAMAGGALLVGGLVFATAYVSVRDGERLGDAVHSEPSTAASAQTEASPMHSHAGERLIASLRFEDRDWVLIADFENRTGESVLDGTLETALGLELVSSRFVNVVPRERIADVLRLMRRPLETTVDADVGREICRRDGGIRALITGRVEKVGSSYAVTSQIVNPSSGVVLASLREETASQGELLRAVRRQAFRVRQALGETLETIRKAQPELDHVTTSSLQALHLYSQASKLLHGESWRSEPAARLLKQAVAEDPEFASALILLAWAIRNQDGAPRGFAGEFAAMNEALHYAARAADLVAHTSDAERYFILGSYQSLLSEVAPAAEVREVRRRAIAEYEALLRIKPDHYWGAINLAGERDRQDLAMDRGRPHLDTADAWARAADSRPMSAYTNAMAFRRLSAVGNSARARIYMRRAHEAAVRMGDEFGRYSAMLLPAQEALLYRDVVRSKQIVDDVRQRWTSARLRPLNDDVVGQKLVSLYADLGRFADARAVMTERPTTTHGSFDWFLMIFGFPDARESLRAFVDSHYPRVSKGPLNPLWVHYAHLFHELDDVEQLRAISDRIRDGGRTPEVFGLEIDGHLAVAEERLEEGIDFFQSVQETGFQDPWARRRFTIEIADAWKARGELAKAAAVLHSGTRDRWPSDALQEGAVAFWVAARDRLADASQALGSENTAKKIDAELLQLLSIADDDHPVIARVKARQAAR